MSARGRPLRFLALVSVGWVGARIAFLWPQTGSLPDAIKALAPANAANPAPIPSRYVAVPAAKVSKARPMSKGLPIAPVLAFRIAPATSVIAANNLAADLSLPPTPIAIQPSALPDRIDPLPGRWSASGWFASRAGSTIGNAPGGQLGGSQAGARLAYLLSSSERIAAFARVTTPLNGKGREAAIGLEWQPGAAPVRVVAEQRFGLDGTPGGTGLGLVAGYDADVRHFRVETYGQAGAIARQRIEPYADGAARLTRRIGRFSLGAGIWGAAQRDAQRLDIGPTATVKIGPTRLSLDWRQRVAGHARPGSGPAFTIGGDF